MPHLSTERPTPHDCGNRRRGTGHAKRRVAKEPAWKRQFDVDPCARRKAIGEHDHSWWAPADPPARQRPSRSSGAVPQLGAGWGRPERWKVMPAWHVPCLAAGSHWSPAALPGLAAGATPDAEASRLAAADESA